MNILHVLRGLYLSQIKPILSDPQGKDENNLATEMHGVHKILCFSLKCCDLS